MISLIKNLKPSRMMPRGSARVLPDNDMHHVDRIKIYHRNSLDILRAELAIFWKDYPHQLN